MDPRTQKSFEFANEGTRQLLTLSAAILALTVTLATDVTTGDPAFLAAAWAAYLISIVCGIWTLFALMAELDPGARKRDRTPHVGARGVRVPSFIQIGTFALGAALLLLFGWSAL